MKITYTIITIAVIALLGFAIGWNSNQSEPSVGSVQTASEYHYTTVSGPKDDLVIKSETGVLGSVVINLLGTASLTLYDATTTNVNLRALATTSLPVIASLPASQAAGTYTYDVVALNGIVADWGTGTQASSTITWR